MNASDDAPHYVVDHGNRGRFLILVVGGVVVLFLAAVAFGLGRPFFGLTCALAGLSLFSLGMFLKPGKQSEGGGCLLFGMFIISGFGAVLLGGYALLQQLLH